MNTTALWSEMPGVQYTCETEPGLSVKIRSKMLLEAEWLIFSLHWLRPYSSYSQTNHIFSYLANLVFPPRASKNQGG